MKIYEVIYNNGEHYEDNTTYSYYYETFEEAMVKLTSYKTITGEDRDFNQMWDIYPTVMVNELELGTQRRECVAKRWLCGVPKRKESPRITLGDIEALEAPRAKLAGA